MKPVVVYVPAMLAQIDSFSPGARKPSEVVASWQQLTPASEVCAPCPGSYRRVLHGA
ncbi:MAG: hypothetical protein LKM32_14180 [Chiayiivirga sp.]|jgi:hypothetical protein|uniref:hypothetical protein n=1 Tax=Chiayiivirga sp. TaxID=2041042 RepID=UPI0025BBBC73|nr:hypothetical protein [Chiayiivirga sp.]MCI1730478.1 hypothetical protein [Chiayiivirga sp.]